MPASADARRPEACSVAGARSRILRRAARRLVLAVCALPLLPAAGSWAQGGPVRLVPKPSNAILTVGGGSQQYTAYKVFFSNSAIGTPQVAPFPNSVAWSEDSGGTIIQIDVSGKVTPVAAGTAKITARSGPFHGSTFVTVTATALKSITVAVPVAQLPVGEQEQLTATGTLTDGSQQDITDFVTWSSSDPTTIAVTNQVFDAKVRPRAPDFGSGMPLGSGNNAGASVVTRSQGVASALQQSVNPITITATANKTSGTGAITGAPPVLVKITVSPASASVVASGSGQPAQPQNQFQFHALGTFSDGSIKDVTTDSNPPDSVAWSSGGSDATVVASGASAGLATGITIAGGGGATIFASAPDRTSGSGFISGNAFLRVASSAGIAYVVSGATNTVTAYNADFAFGFMAPLLGTIPASSVPTGKLPLGVAVGGPGGNFVYVVNGNDSTVSIYQAVPNPTPQTGVLKPVATTQTDPNPVAIALDSSGSFAYVSCINGIGGTTPGTIDAFTIDSGGLLHAVNAVAAALDPARLAVPPAAPGVPGELLYVPNSNSNSISGFTISQPTASPMTLGGRLTPIAGSPFAITGNKPVSVAADPSGRYVYGANNRDSTLSAYGIVPLLGTTPQSGGNLDALGSAASTGSDRPAEVAVDPSGRFVYSANTTASGSGNGDVTSFAIQPDGSLAAVGSAQNAGVDPLAIAVESSGQYAYVLNSGSGTINEFLIGADGSLTPPMSGRAPFFPAPPGPTDIAIAPAAGKTIASLGLTPANQAVNPGATVAYTVTASYTDGSTQIVTSSSALTPSGGASGGVVFNLNVAQALQAGTYTITAKLGGASATTSLTVNAQPAISSIAVTPANGSVVIGGTLRFTATATLTGGGTEDVSNVATWASSDTTIATIQNSATNPATNGVATAVALGSAKISASLGGATSAQVTLLVTSGVPLVSISIQPNYPFPQSPTKIPQGGKVGFVATGTFADGSTGPVSVTWNSSAPTLVNIDSNGLATGIAPTPTGSPASIAATSTANPSIHSNALEVAIVPVQFVLYSASDNAFGTFGRIIAEHPFQLGNLQTLATGEGVFPALLGAPRSGEYLFSFYDVNGTIETFPTTISVLGANVPVTGFQSGSKALALAADPGGRFLFASFSGGSAGSGIAAYKLNYLGAGNLLIPAPTAFPANADSMAVDPAGLFLYAASGSSLDVYSIDQTSGALSQTSSQPANAPSQLLLSSDGAQLFAFGGDSVNAYSVSNGILTLEASTSSVGGTDLAIDPQSPPRFIYTITENAGSNQLTAYQISAGKLTSLAGATTDPLPIHVAADPNGRFVYTMDLEDAVNENDKISAFQINPGNTPFFTQITGSPFMDIQHPNAMLVVGPAN